MLVQIVDKQRRAVSVVKTALIGVSVLVAALFVFGLTAGLINMAVVKIIQFLY